MKIDLEEIEIETDPYPKSERLLIDIPQFSGLLTLSVRHFLALLAEGKIGPRPLKFGRSTRFLASEAGKWLACDGPPDRSTWDKMKKCKGCMAAFEVCRDCRTAAMVAACSGSETEETND